jgi:hypothetical protein
VRRALLLDALPAQEDDGDADAGLLLLAPDDTVAGADPAAQRWLAELEATGPPASLPPVVRAVATRARDVAAGAAAGPVAARARVRTPSGVWLIVRARSWAETTRPALAVTIERARAHDLAPLIAEAHDLTPASAPSRSSSRRASPRTRSRRACTSRRGRCRTT